MIRLQIGFKAGDGVEPLLFLGGVAVGVGSLVVVERGLRRGDGGLTVGFELGAGLGNFDRAVGGGSGQVFAVVVEGAGASSPEKRFSTLVCRTLGWDEINLGIGGTTMTGRGDDGLIADEESGIGRRSRRSARAARCRVYLLRGE